MNSPAPSSCRKKSIAPFSRVPYLLGTRFAHRYTTWSISEQAHIHPRPWISSTDHQQAVLRGIYRKIRKKLEPCSTMKRPAQPAAAQAAVAAPECADCEISAPGNGFATSANQVAR